MSELPFIGYFPKRFSWSGAGPGLSQDPEMLPRSPMWVEEVQAFRASSAALPSAGSWIGRESSQDFSWHSDMGCWHDKKL